MQRIVILLLCLLPCFCLAQIKVRVFVDGMPESDNVFADTLDMKNFLEAQKIRWIDQGYYFSGVDSVKKELKGYEIYTHLGSKMTMKIEGVKSQKFSKSLSKNLSNYTNNGYPFASLTLDSVSLNGQSLNARLKIDKGPEIQFDSIFFLSKPTTNKSYIFQLLETVPGEAFDESAYARINQTIERSPFLSLNRPPDISFSNNKAQVYLDLEESFTNSFQGVVGLQQNPSGGSSLVGSFDFSAQNLFRSGHEFSINWESFAESSQELDLRYKHAFLFKSKISPSIRFALLKQDTTFLIRTTAIDINSFLGANISLKIGYEGTNGTLISSTIENLSQRNLADYQRNFYQLALSKGHPSSLTSFNQGLIWHVSLGGGSKDIVRNVGLPDDYYDTIQLKTNFLRVENRLAYQFKIGKRQSIYHDLQIGILDNDELLTNELYRIGGLTTLRGFNEKFFFASRYGLSRFEFRSFFENSSFIYAFYDQLVFKRSSNVNAPSGIGLGFALETSSGQFSFALASGNSDSQNFSFSELRAHFGFVTTF